MKLITGTLLFWLFSTIAFAQASVPQAPKAKVLFLRCGRLIYDASKAPMAPADVIITNDKVTAVGEHLAVPAGAEQMDWSRYTVLPGFIDAHIHLWTGPFMQPVSPGLSALRASRAMEYALNSGVIAVRVLGTEDFTDVALEQAVDEGTIPGPRIVPAGHALSIPAGHADHFTLPFDIPLDEYYTPLNGFISSPADAEKAVHLQIKYGAKVIKVLASGGVGSPLDSPTAEQLSPEELRIIVEQAHMDHLKVAAHDENLATIMAALHAGVDSIEHGSDLDQAAVDYMKAHHVFLVPTVYIVDNIITNGAKEHLPDYMLRKAHELAQKHFASFKLATQNGLTMAAGSDQTYEAGHGTVLDEMITEVKYGMSPQQALVSATINGASLLGMDDLGTVAVGKAGDLVAVEGDPLTDIQAVKNTRAVVFKGRLVRK